MVRLRASNDVTQPHERMTRRRGTIDRLRALQARRLNQQAVQEVAAIEIEIENKRRRRREEDLPQGRGAPVPSPPLPPPRSLAYMVEGFGCRHRVRVPRSPPPRKSDSMHDCDVFVRRECENGLSFRTQQSGSPRAARHPQAALRLKQNTGVRTNDPPDCFCGPPSLPPSHSLYCDPPCPWRENQDGERMKSMRMRPFDEILPRRNFPTASNLSGESVGASGSQSSALKNLHRGWRERGHTYRVGRGQRHHAGYAHDDGLRLHRHGLDGLCHRRLLAGVWIVGRRGWLHVLPLFFKTGNSRTICLIISR